MSRMRRYDSTGPGEHRESVAILAQVACPPTMSRHGDEREQESSGCDAAQMIRSSFETVGGRLAIEPAVDDETDQLLRCPKELKTTICLATGLARMNSGQATSRLSGGGFFDLCQRGTGPHVLEGRARLLGPRGQL